MTAAVMMYLAGLPLAALALDATNALTRTVTPVSVRVVVIAIWPAVGAASLVAIMAAAARRYLAALRGKA